ncbi:MAG: hypothetical protein JXJ30_03970 [Halothiobacillaceae bacterium]|nr:hypothetical protein [Halothiobacillaceae bacterium]
MQEPRQDQSQDETRHLTRAAETRATLTEQAAFEQVEGEPPGAVELIIDPGVFSNAVIGLIAALRDRANRRVVVHLGDTRIGDDIDQQMVSLGFRRVRADIGVYLFDIDTYKDTPDWLNARHWAHPELWGKYRW